ncbi:FRG domain-containing protein [Bacillus sp. 1P06AnD]|uniref:FRG domain-containing protein n=1 Tax=Bacillus sp. 1P06AnD TaxID=3132208 RepID=UPI0039A147D2
MLDEITSIHPINYKQQAFDDWDIVYFEQHYGIPTRFLDWSTALEVGLYFATQNGGNNDACIWILDPLKFNELIRGEYEIKQANAGTYKTFIKNSRDQQPVAICVDNPSSANERLLQQKGTFLYTGLDYVDFRDFVSDKANDKRLDPKEFLFKIEINQNECGKIIDYLYEKFQINASTLKLNEKNFLADRLSYEKFLTEKKLQEIL